MNTNRKILLHCAAFGLLFSTTYTLAGRPAQAQVSQQTRIPIPLAVQEAAREGEQLARTAATDLHAGRYAQAESEARQSEAMEILPGVGQEIIAAALDAQGKDQEALKAYKIMVVDQKAWFPRLLLPYAMLLLRSGQWEQSVTIYNQGISCFSERSLVRVNNHFSPTIPEPAALAVALHIAYGMVYNNEEDWAGDSQNKEAMAEYGKALQLAPNDALVNYYYGSGWQRLTPAEKAKFGNAAQAKAALQKAAKLGEGDIKKNAEEALKAFAPPR